MRIEFREAESDVHELRVGDEGRIGNECTADLRNGEGEIWLLERGLEL